jgi:hypothetical protein
MLKRLLSSVLLIVLLLGAVFYSPTQTAQAAVSNWQKSTTIEPRSSTDFASANFQQSISNYAADGGNYISLIIPYVQTDLYSTDIKTTSTTPTDDSLKSAIQYAHSKGLKVQLKPHLDPQSGDWRAMIYPSDRDTWYQKYNEILVKYATLAQATGAEQICVGAELYRMAAQTQNYNNTARWKTMIANVRKVYSGQLTYSANHTGPSEFKEIQFWDALDYIGISAYFPLDANNNNPTVESLKAAWAPIEANDIAPVQKSWNKPVLFTEVGYRSVQGAHIEPFAWWRSGGVDEAEQARDYEALFAFWNDKSYMQGVYWWNWESNPNAGGSGDSGYTVQHKQAEQVMKKWYTGGASTSPSPSASVTPSASPSPVASPTPSATNNPNTTYTMTGSVSPNPVAQGTPGKIAVNINPSSKMSNVLVDIEVWNAQDQKVGQSSYDNQTLAASTNNSYSFNFTPNSTGTYTVKVGIFNAGWNGLLSWNNGVFTFTSSNGTPIPTAAPTSTPAPTPGVTAMPTPTLPPSSATPVPTRPPGTPQPTPQTSANISIWWPTDGATLSGTNPFKALVDNRDINTYKMYWQVDGGTLNEMGNSTQDYPHKESLVNVSGWSWKGNGPYTINFVAKETNGSQFAQKSVNIFVSR